MLIVMQPDHTKKDQEAVVKKIEEQGYKAHVIPGENRVAIGVTGNTSPLNEDDFLCLSGVAEAIKVTKPYKLAGREFRKRSTKIKVGEASFGDGHFAVIAGPCAVESEEQIHRLAKQMKRAGADILRGGAFKPRTSPYSFQGLGFKGLQYLRDAGKAHGLPVITEALDVYSLEVVEEYADMIQIGARNMQNFAFLQEVGRMTKPVLLKRGISATIEEWLMSAEYILDSGNPNVVLCERGLRGFDKVTRNILDICAVPIAKELSHLPVIIDPSHATGRRSLIGPASFAALAIGASGVMVESHDKPHESMVDGPQAILPNELKEIIKQLRQIAEAMKVKMTTKLGA